MKVYKVTHGFHTRQLNKLFWLLRVIMRKPDPNEPINRYDLGSVTSNFSLYGAIVDIVRTLNSFEQFPIHRVVKRVRIVFDCPIAFLPEDAPRGRDTTHPVVTPSKFRRMFGAKPSTVQLQVMNGKGIYTLTIGNPADFWPAINEFVHQVQDMHNMMMVWKHTRMANRNIENHVYGGASRELNELLTGLSNWLATSYALS
jgi:hypothetical protein